MCLRSILTAAVLVGVSAPFVRAGLYNPAEPDEGVIDVHKFQRFHVAMEDLRILSWPKAPYEYPLRRRYLLASELDPRNMPRAWTTAERLGLSVYLIRRGSEEKLRDAQQLLERLVKQEPHNFVALANLAAAYQKDPVNSAQAIFHARKAVKAWPRWQDLSKEQQDLVKQLRWDAEQFEHYRVTEGYYLKLLERRRKEPPKQPMAAEKLDVLFGDDKDPVRYVGDNGRFEPGKLAAVERKKLPGGQVEDAIRVVQQLLCWLPGDARLLWQLAELYSVAGIRVIDDEPVDHRVTAYKVYDVLTNLLGSYQYRPLELLDHKNALAKDLQDNPPPVRKAQDNERAANPDSPPDEDGTPARSNWEMLLIGFGAGLLVMLLVIWQVHEIRRRYLRRRTNRLEAMHLRQSGGQVRDTRVEAGTGQRVPQNAETHIRAKEKPGGA